MKNNMRLTFNNWKQLKRKEDINNHGMTEYAPGPHITFFYVCCMEKEQFYVVGDIINYKFNWNQHEISFDKIQCTFSEQRGSIYLYIEVDNDGQQLLNEWVTKLETFIDNDKDFKSNTKDKSFKMYHRNPLFHSSLIWFDYHIYDAVKIINTLNNNIKPNTWSTQKLPLKKPCYSRWQSEGLH